MKSRCGETQDYPLLGNCETRLVATIKQNIVLGGRLDMG
jgi:hypothetical protein